MPIFEVAFFEAEQACGSGGVEGRAEGWRELAHPEYLAEGYGNSARLQVQGDALDGFGQDLLPDNERRTEGRMAREGHLPARCEDADVVATVALFFREEER